MNGHWLRLNLVRYGDIAAFGGVIISLIALGFRIMGIESFLTARPFSYFMGGMWLMLLGALIRLETLMTVGKEKSSHPELYTDTRVK